MKTPLLSDVKVCIRNIGDQEIVFSNKKLDQEELVVNVYSYLKQLYEYKTNIETTLEMLLKYLSKIEQYIQDSEQFFNYVQEDIKNRK